jgi:hypothetical protein
MSWMYEYGTKYIKHKRGGLWALFSVLFVMGNAACQWNVGSLDVQLIHTATEADNPLNPDLIKKLRVSIKGDGLALHRYEFNLKVGGSATVEDVPIGSNRVLTVEGLDVSGYARSRGISVPFELKEGISRIYLFISRLGEFSAPPAVTASDWAQEYRTLMRSRRAFHTATLLINGRVLVAGGVAAPDPNDYLAKVGLNGALQTAELFNPTAGAFLLLPNGADCQRGDDLCLLAGRAHHSASVLLPRPDVLLVGGEPEVNVGSNSTVAEYFEYATNRFSDAPKMIVPRSRQASCALSEPSRDWLFAGGSGIAFQPINSVELFRSETGDFSEVNTLTVARSGATAVAYSSGVLVIGGWQVDDSQPPTKLKPSNQVDRIEFSDGATTVSSFSLQDARAEHTAVVLTDEQGAPKVFVCGGLNSDLVVSQTCELIDPGAQTSSLWCDMDEPRWEHTATVLQSGRVLISGGFQAPGRSAAFNTAILMNPLEDCFGKRLSMVSKRAGHTATLLQNGMVVLIGGISQSGQMPSEDYEIFNP